MAVGDEARDRFEPRILALLGEWGAALGGGNVRAEADDEYWWTVDLAEGAAYARLSLADAAVRDDPGVEGIVVLVEVVADTGDVLGTLAPGSPEHGWTVDLAELDREVAAAEAINPDKIRLMLSRDISV